MGIDVSTLEHFTISDFSGGLNEEASSFQVKDNELVECQNVSLRDSGAIKNRLGDSNYQVQSGTVIAMPVKGMHRYIRSDGTKKVLIYSGTASGTTYQDGMIFADDDAGAFDSGNPIVSRFTSNDGYCRFAQYLDCVIFSTDRKFLTSYNSAANDVVITPVVRPNRVSGGDVFGTFTYDIDGYLENKIYVYRFAYDVFHDDVFWGETALENLVVGSEEGVKVIYQQLEVDLSGYSGYDNKIDINKSYSYYRDDLIRTNTSKINIYRAGPFGSIDSNYEVKPDPNFFYIGTIDRDDFIAADVGDRVFTDDGSAPLGRAVRYGRMEIPPSARFLAFHKNMLWLANVKYSPVSELSWKTSGTTITAPHRVFFSDIDGSLPEPAAFYPDAWIDVDPTTGDGITQMVSFQDQLLVVFKANSMWAVLGDNRNNIALRNISPEIGCIAPESLGMLDGHLVWLSNRGVYHWGGTSKPGPLKTEMINKTLFAIPEQARTSACGIGWGKEREYWLAHAGTDSVGYNRYILRYSAKNRSWTRHKHDMGAGVFLESKDADRRSKLLMGQADGPSNFVTRSIVKEADVGWSDVNTSGGGTTNIVWYFKTGFYDGGLPFLEKNFIAVLIQLDAFADTILDVYCDNRLNTEDDAGGSFTISRLSTTWDLIWEDGDPVDPAHEDHPANQRWNSGGYPTIWPKRQQGSTLVMLDDRCWGKRIAFKFSGSNSDEPVEIQAITVFYAPVEGEET